MIDGVDSLHLFKKDQKRQKPVELGRYLVKTYTNQGDVVLDNTFGSGSFLVAALLEGRNFIGIEKNDDVSLFKKEKIDYMDVVKRRLFLAGEGLDKKTKFSLKRKLYQRI